LKFRRDRVQSYPKWSRVARTSDSRICGAADEAVLNKVHSQKNLEKYPCLYMTSSLYIYDKIFAHFLIY
jgi:hypothetical protein